MGESDEALQARAFESNLFAAKYVAKTVTNKLELYYRAVEEMAGSARFQNLLETTIDDPEITDLRRQLNDPNLAAEARDALRARLIDHPTRKKLQERLQDLLHDESEPDVASWFVTGPEGMQLARAPEHSTVGDNFSWRTYFHGGNEDYPEDWRARPNDHITKPNLSSVFFSQVNDRWMVTISTPVYKEEANEETNEKDSRFLGVIGLSVDVRQFVKQESKRPFVALVDWRPGPNKGLILQHPLFEKLLADHKQVPDRFPTYRLKDDSELPDSQAARENYIDPLAKDPQGKEYDKHWLAAAARVSIRDGQTGWIVIVQESYDGAIGSTLEKLKQSLFARSLLAGGLIAVLSTLLWALVIRALGEPTRSMIRPPAPTEEAAT
jgi:eukaryotic-like serine/threonine-protein kinase